jgi:hypothetical protein
VVTVVGSRGPQPVTTLLAQENGSGLCDKKKQKCANGEKNKHPHKQIKHSSSF